MHEQDLSNDDTYEAWVKNETRHLDLVASWDNLCVIYDSLRFSDQIADQDRMEEFRWIIKETNKFLTRAKKGLLSSQNLTGSIMYLSSQLNCKNTSPVSDRKSLAYNKIKQVWIQKMIAHLNTMIEKEGEVNVWNS